MADINQHYRGYDAPALHVQRRHESYMRQLTIASPTPYGFDDIKNQIETKTRFSESMEAFAEIFGANQGCMGATIVPNPA